MYNGNFGMRTPEQIQAEYNQIMNNYRNLYDRANQIQNLNSQPNFGNQQINPNPQITSTVGGEYRYVSNYEEVLNASTRLDGTATLFVDFSNGIIWSKKFINGSHEIQTFKFHPLVNTELKEDEPKINLDKIEITKNDIEKIMKRIENLENKEAVKNECATTNTDSKINN